MRVSKYLSKVNIRKLVMASFTQPIEYCVSYNKESPDTLLCLGKKLQELGLVLSKLQSYTAAQLYLTGLYNYILPDTVDVSTSRIEMVLSLLFYY